MSDGLAVLGPALLGFTLVAFGLALLLPWAQTDEGDGLRAGFWSAGTAGEAGATDGVRGWFSGPSGDGVLLVRAGVALVLGGLVACALALVMAAVGQRTGGGATTLVASLLLLAGFALFAMGIDGYVAQHGAGSRHVWGPAFFLGLAGLCSAVGATATAFWPTGRRRGQPGRA